MTRWTPARKAAVAEDVLRRRITRLEAVEQYGLSEEEIDSWCESYREGGALALRVNPSRCVR